MNAVTNQGGSSSHRMCQDVSTVATRSARPAKAADRDDYLTQHAAVVSITNRGDRHVVEPQAVAEILGLAYRNTVVQYQQRYSDTPRPVFDLGKGRVKLWLRSEVTASSDQQAASGRVRSARRVPR